jgi:hypothetical protein
MWLMIKKVGIVVAAWLVSACALFQGQNAVGEQLVIQEATAVAIQAGCSTTACYDARAAKVLIVANALKTVTVGQGLSDIVTLVQNTLQKVGMTPEEVAPLQAFAGALTSWLQAKLAGSKTTATVVADINTAAGWIAQTCSLY